MVERFLSPSRGSRGGKLMRNCCLGLTSMPRLGVGGVGDHQRKPAALMPGPYWLPLFLPLPVVSPPPLLLTDAAVAVGRCCCRPTATRDAHFQTACRIAPMLMLCSCYAHAVLMLWFSRRGMTFQTRVGSTRKCTPWYAVPCYAIFRCAGRGAGNDLLTSAACCAVLLCYAIPGG